MAISSFTVQQLNRDGDGYMIVTVDDGSSFGQLVHDVPTTGTLQAIDAYLTQIAEEALNRVNPTARPPLRQEVLNILNKPRTPVRP